MLASTLIDSSPYADIFQPISRDEELSIVKDIEDKYKELESIGGGDDDVDSDLGSDRGSDNAAGCKVTRLTYRAGVNRYLKQCILEVSKERNLSYNRVLAIKYLIDSEALLEEESAKRRGGGDGGDGLGDGGDEEGKEFHTVLHDDALEHVQSMYLQHKKGASLSGVRTRPINDAEADDYALKSYNPGIYVGDEMTDGEFEGLSREADEREKEKFIEDMARYEHVLLSGGDANAEPPMPSAAVKECISYLGESSEDEGDVNISDRWAYSFKSIEKKGDNGRRPRKKRVLDSFTVESKKSDGKGVALNDERTDKDRSWGGEKNRGRLF